MKNRCFNVVVFCTALSASSKRHEFTVVAANAKAAIDRAIQRAKRTYGFKRGWVVESLLHIGEVS